MKASLSCTTASPRWTKDSAISVLSLPMREDSVHARWHRSLRHHAMLAVLVLIGLVCLPLHSQTITADVLGTVTDPTGAVVPNAAVAVQDLGTNATRAAQTSDSGEYIFNLLPIGTYTLTINATGFKTYKVTGFTLSAGDRLRIDAKLKMGASTQTVEVQAGAELVQTDSSSVGMTVSQEVLADMPLNGRNLTNLITLQPGVNRGMPSNSTSGAQVFDRRQVSSVSANGAKEFLNDRELDGIDNNDRFSGLQGVKPSPDAVQEIQVQTQNFPADIGRTGGAAVLFVTKAGTNQFHGNAYEFFRNDIFDAKEYFTPAGFPNQEWRQNQFGGSLGGPIKKDKSFFFVSAEEFRLVQGINSPVEQVPSAADDEKFYGQNNSIAVNLFNMFPAPIPSLGSNGAYGTDVPDLYVSSDRATQYVTTVDSRVDEHFSSKDQLFVRYNYNPTSTVTPGLLPACSNGSCNGDTADNGIDPVGSGFIGAPQPQYPGSETVTTHGAQINWVHVFSPKLLMELRTGFMRLNLYSKPTDSGTNTSSLLGIPNPDLTAGDSLATGMPSIHFIDGSVDLGDQNNMNLQQASNNYQWNGDVIYTRGAHNLKFGAGLIRRQLNYLLDWQPEGWFFFENPVQMISGNYPYPYAPPAPIVEITQSTYYKEYFRSWEPSVYVLDNWRARPWLTLNLGVRYDVYTPLSDAKAHYSNFDLNKLSFNVGGRAGVQTDHMDVAPRIGFAARLGRWAVMHGGYGIVYYPGDFLTMVSLYNPPYYNGVSCSPLFGTGGCSSSGYGSLSGGPLPSPRTVSNPDSAVTDSSYSNSLTLLSKQTNFRASYLQQFDLTLQKQFGANAVTVGYDGSLGRREVIENGWYPNLPQPSSSGVITLAYDPSTYSWAAPYYYSTLTGVGLMQYFENEATSNYNALQLIFDRRVATGLHVNANYTWSHALDHGGGYENGGAPATWRFNYAYEYGNSDNDVKDRLAFTGTYDIPFGKTLHGAGAVLVKNWTLAASGFWQTGLPFTVADSALASDIGGAYGTIQTAMRVNVVSNNFYSSSNKSIHNWLNPNAFSVPAINTTVSPETFTLGNERANQLYGPHVREVDLAAIKDVPIKENLKAQFRAECFNISNTPSFEYPINEINSANFGAITQTIYNMFPRVFQFALKIEF